MIPKESSSTRSLHWCHLRTTPPSAKTICLPDIDTTGALTRFGRPNAPETGGQDSNEPSSPKRNNEKNCLNQWSTELLESVWTVVFDSNLLCCPQKPRCLMHKTHSVYTPCFIHGYVDGTTC